MKHHLIKEIENELIEAEFPNFIRTNLGKVIRREMKRLGYWKNRKRGRPRNNGLTTLRENDN